MTRTDASVARAGVVGLTGGLVGAATSLLLAVLVGHTLGAAGAGRFFAMVAGVAIASNVLELGADTGLVRHVSAALALDGGDRVRGLVGIAVRPVVTGVLLLVVTVAFAAPWLEGVAGGGRAWLVVVATASGLAALLAVLLGAVRAMSSALSVTLVQNVGLPLARLGLVGGCVAAGIAAGPSPWRAAALAWLAPIPAALLVALVLLVRAERRHRGSRTPVAPTRAEGRAFWAFSAPRGVSAAAEICLEWVDVLIVGAWCSPAEAGVYAVVTRAARSAELVQQASRLAVGPLISAALAQGRGDDVHRLHRDVAVATTVLSWPFFVIAAYYAPSLLGLFGAEFAEGATALRILCLGLALSYAVGAVQSILLMGGRSAAQLGNKVVCLAVNVGLNLVLVPRLGIVGAAIAWAVVLVLDAGLAWTQILVGLRLRLGLRAAGAAGLAVAAATGGICVAVDLVGDHVASGAVRRGSAPIAEPVAAAVVAVALIAAVGAAASSSIRAGPRRLLPRSRQQEDA